ncbi:MAG: hypothetical protein H6577_20310 [Lewinellaceae bacterium]|nr:hypothetical protein [Saprospiraceae bacterium]MCB9340474.1 hypothetical protein [Lewinellaceae bacterium]
MSLISPKPQLLHLHHLHRRKPVFLHHPALDAINGATNEELESFYRI